MIFPRWYGNFKENKKVRTDENVFKNYETREYTDLWSILLVRLI